MREIKTCPNTGWQQMPTEELDQVLQAELEKKHPNEEVVLPILRELEEREKDIPAETTPEVLEILDKLSKHNTSSKQSIHKRKWLAGIAAAAAVVCIVVMTMSPTARAESLFDILVRWTSSIFEFIDPDNDASYPVANSDFTTDNPGLQQLYDKVTELGVTEFVVPMWLPEGFMLSDLKERSMPGGNSIYTNFKNGTNDISITYRISTDISAKVEKEETGIEVFEAGEINHFIMDNDEYLSVTWSVDGVECLLNTNIAKEDLYTIIKSIYRSELSK